MASSSDHESTDCASTDNASADSDGRPQLAGRLRSPSHRPASPKRARKILEKLPNEILDMILGNLLSDTAEQMDYTNDTFIQWVPSSDAYFDRSFRKAQGELYDVALASRIFSSCAKRLLYRMLEITHDQGLLAIWENVSKYPANADSIRYLLCEVSFDSPTVQRNVVMRTSDLLARTPLPRWADGSELSIHDLQPEDDLPRRLFVDIIWRCGTLKRLHLHREAALLIQGLPMHAGAPRIPLDTIGRCLCALVFDNRNEMEIHRQKTCGERLHDCAQLVLSSLREIEIRAHDGIWQIALDHRGANDSSTVIQRILSLAIDHNLFYEARPVLQRVWSTRDEMSREIRAAYVPVDSGDPRAAGTPTRKPRFESSTRNSRERAQDSAC